jgi:hypothetical protein
MSKMNASKLLTLPVLITSAINVSAAKTVLTDAKARLELTLNSVQQWRETQGVSHVIVCDGSGFDLGSHIDNIFSNQKSVGCEVISFTNDVAGVKA